MGYFSSVIIVNLYPCMGFTFSHPALILPCRYFPKRFYSLSGLIAGSMVPDLEYFIRWNTISIYSHTLKGIFWFDMPFALFFIFLYHLLIRNLLISNLPVFFRSRLSRFQHFDWISYSKKNWIVVLYSTLIGIISHLFWDSFTSYGGYFVRSSAFLMSHSDFLIFRTRNYNILKYASSIVGLIILFYRLLRMSPSNATVNVTINKNYWILMFSISVPLIVLRNYLTDPDDFSLSSFLKTSISSVLLAILVASFCFRKKNELSL